MVARFACDLPPVPPVHPWFMDCTSESSSSWVCFVCFVLFDKLLDKLFELARLGLELGHQRPTVG
jgi:hypothetical protein